MMKISNRSTYSAKVLLIVCLAFLAASASAQTYSLEQIKGNPYPTELTSSANTARIAWVFNERGVRNVWVAEGPDYTARKLTNYTKDERQELVDLEVSADGKWVVYVRGGSEGNWSDVPPNPAQNPVEQKMQ